MSEISSSVFITDIREQKPEMAVRLEEKAKGYGVRMVRAQRQYTVVRIGFVIRDQDVERRKNVMQDVQKWAAKGGKLTINDRPGQVLHVVCTDPPMLGSALKWTEEMHVDFTAYTLPFWEGVETHTYTTTGSTRVYVPGTHDVCQASAVVTNKSGVLTDLLIQTEKSSIRFEGLSVANGGKVEVGHDDNGYFYAKHGTQSLIGKRTTGSDDDLLVESGYSEVLVQGNTPVEMAFSVKGWWI